MLEELYETIHPCWNELFDKYREDINNILTYDIRNNTGINKPIYPPEKDILKVFSMNVADIKIVLLGQDPYHGPMQANGLSFSVNPGVAIPPSLRNIYKELVAEYPDRNYEFSHGDISRWFYEEKIFLLNTSLTVTEGMAGRFMTQWKPITDDVIKFICENNDHCIFLLLGNHAKEKRAIINDDNRIVMGVHPSPLSASKGFFGSNIFVKVEEKIGNHINWSLS